MMMMTTTIIFLIITVNLSLTVENALTLNGELYSCGDRRRHGNVDSRTAIHPVVVASVNCYNQFTRHVMSLPVGQRGAVGPNAANSLVFGRRSLVLECPCDLNRGSAGRRSTCDVDIRTYTCLYYRASVD